MNGKLVGYYRSSGTFTPKPDAKNPNPAPMDYDNLVLQFMSELDNYSKDGYTIEGKRLRFTELKLKMKFVQDKVALPVQRVSDFDDYLNKPFQWFFNEFGNIERVEPI